MARSYRRRMRWRSSRARFFACHECNMMIGFANQVKKTLRPHHDVPHRESSSSSSSSSLSVCHFPLHPSRRHADDGDDSSAASTKQLFLSSWHSTLLSFLLSPSRPRLAKGALSQSAVGGTQVIFASHGQKIIISAAVVLPVVIGKGRILFKTKTIRVEEYYQFRRGCSSH